MQFILKSHTYTAREPATYAVDLKLNETRKKIFLDTFPEMRETPRPEVKKAFDNWLEDIEGTLTDSRITLATLLIPEGDAPDLATVPDEFFLSCSSFEIDEVFGFFSKGRMIAFLEFQKSKNPGLSTTNQETESTPQNSSLSNTKTD